MHLGHHTRALRVRLETPRDAIVPARHDASIPLAPALMPRCRMSSHARHMHVERRMRGDGLNRSGARG
jgi:hypothetical protein